MTLSCQPFATPGTKSWRNGTYVDVTDLVGTLARRVEQYDVVQTGWLDLGTAAAGWHATATTARMSRSFMVTWKGWLAVTWDE